MMRPLGVVAVLAVLACLVACQVEDGQRSVSRNDHYSSIKPAGWAEKRDRGSTVFVARAEGAWPRNTIAIRSVPVEGEWVEKRTADRVVQATAKVLAALPQSTMSKTALRMSDGRWASAVFDVTFTPSSKPGVRYERRHVVLVGRRYVFHVVHTAPEGALVGTADAFEAVVDSLREEV
jgi:hypothetical protein